MVNAHSKQNNAMWTEKMTIQSTPANLNLLDKGISYQEVIEANIKQQDEEGMQVSCTLIHRDGH